MALSRTSSFSNKISSEALNPGDHIYSWRRAYAYAHYGIFVGNDKVVHFTEKAGLEIATGTFIDRILSSLAPTPHSPCPDCGDQSNQEGVITSCLKCFLARGDLYRYRYGVSKTGHLTQGRGGTCSRAVSDSPEKVIHRAKSLLKNNGFGPYDLCNNNCEDFALYCKTELMVTKENENTSLAGSSGQVSFTRMFAFGILAAVTVPVIIAAASVKSLTSDIGQRTDVARVPVERLPAKKDNKNKKDK